MTRGCSPDFIRHAIRANSHCYMEPQRLRQWWILGDGIAFVTLAGKIQGLLGPDATVRPGHHSDGRQGYYVTACQPLTEAMIDGLKKDSAVWFDPMKYMQRADPLTSEYATSTYPQESSAPPTLDYPTATAPAQRPHTSAYIKHPYEPGPRSTTVGKPPPQRSHSSAYIKRPYEPTPYSTTVEKSLPQPSYTSAYQTAAYLSDLYANSVKKTPAQPLHSSTGGKTPYRSNPSSAYAYPVENAPAQSFHSSPYQNDSSQCSPFPPPTSAINTSQHPYDKPGYSLYYTKSTTTFETFEYKPRSDDPRHTTTPSSPYSSISGPANPRDSFQGSWYPPSSSMNGRDASRGRGDEMWTVQNTSGDHVYGDRDGRPPASDGDEGVRPRAGR